MANKLTLKSINKTLETLGAKEELLKGNCYFYFAEGNTAMWKSTIVYVPRLDDLSLEQWVEEWECLSGDVN